MIIRYDDVNENGNWLEKSLVPAILRWIDNIINGTFGIQYHLLISSI